MSVRHIAERALERHGIVLTAHDVNVILAKIGRGEAERSNAAVNPRSQAWRVVTASGVEIVAVTMQVPDTGRYVLRTVFPFAFEKASGTFKLGDVIGEA